jgi:hypothetical protein
MDEQPAYSEISELEMHELETEFGRPLTHELALWLIRCRINRTAIQLMIDENRFEEQPPGTPSKRAA